MVDTLYDDFYEGFLHTILLIIPIIMCGISTSIDRGSSAALGSLIVSIANSIYAKRNIYQDPKYQYNWLVKAEMMFALVMLAFAMCWGVCILYKELLEPAGVNYVVLLYFYSFSVFPHVIETTRVAVRDLCMRERRYFAKKRNTTGFDLSVANIN